MSDYRMNYSKLISMKDADNLKSMLDIIDNNDELTIVFEEKLISETDKILKVLHENGFDCKTDTRGIGSNFMITATKHDTSEVIEIM